MENLILSLIFTQHIGFSGEYNEIHPHVRYQNEAFIAGAYLNSEKRVSLYAGGIIERGSLFGELGLVSGYTSYSVLPFVRVGINNGNSSIFVSPAYEYPNTIGVVIGIEVKF